VTITARTSSSASIRSNAAIISFIIVPVNALSLSGRCSVIGGDVVGRRRSGSAVNASVIGPSGP
jgi:hypothetical protein